MDTSFEFMPEPYFCDAGQHQGQLARQFRGTAYMTTDEHADATRNGGLTVTVQPAGPGERTELPARYEAADPAALYEDGSYGVAALVVALLTPAQLDEYRAGAQVKFTAYLEAPAG